MALANLPDVIDRMEVAAISPVAANFTGASRAPVLPAGLNWQHSSNLEAIKSPRQQIPVGVVVIPLINLYQLRLTRTDERVNRLRTNSGSVKQALPAGLPPVTWKSEKPAC